MNLETIFPLRCKHRPRDRITTTQAFAVPYSEHFKSGHTYDFYLHNLAK